ncbi:MAG: ABC transporter ATP-binding protein [Microbacteriaceae bacterium]|nr:ABC transporter ATP-binding protein [Microbacteriaceae bacterium]
MTTDHQLSASEVSVAYGEVSVLDGLSIDIAPGRITAIVGANASGKSTLLRAMSRLVAPTAGAVLLDGAAIHKLPSREVARVLGLLPQSPTAPEGIVVADLVARGRHPHLGMLQRWTAEDEAAVERALAATDTLDLADRTVDELSGGQRQRVWIAMALAQETGVLLLDEPTTYLDVTHQVETLDLLQDLNHARGTTIVMVLHDLNLAARYADQLVAVASGRIAAVGAPSEVLTAGLVEEVFGLRCEIIDDPVSGTPLVVPIGRHRVRSAIGAVAGAAGA